MSKSCELTVEQQELFSKLTRLQQRVAIGVLGGLSQTAAYRQAGGKAKSEGAEYACASRVCRNVKVSAFIDSVQQRRVSSTIMDREEALMRLTIIARSTLAELYEWTEQGLKLKPSARLSAEQAYCIREITQTGDRIQIKTHSAMDAIRQLSKMQGWDSANKYERKETEVEVPEIDDIELARELVFLLGKAAAEKKRQDEKVEKPKLKIV